MTELWQLGAVELAAKMACGIDDVRAAPIALAGPHHRDRGARR